MSWFQFHILYVQIAYKGRAIFHFFFFFSFCFIFFLLFFWNFAGFLDDKKYKIPKFIYKSSIECWKQSNKKTFANNSLASTIVYSVSHSLYVWVSFGKIEEKQSIIVWPPHLSTKTWVWARSFVCHLKMFINILITITLNSTFFQLLLFGLINCNVIISWKKYKKLIEKNYDN